jgi:hypothetical protein
MNPLSSNRGTSLHREYDVIRILDPIRCASWDHAISEQGTWTHHTMTIYCSGYHHQCIDIFHGIYSGSCIFPDERIHPIHTDDSIIRNHWDPRITVMPLDCYATLPDRERDYSRSE